MNRRTVAGVALLLLLSAPFVGLALEGPIVSSACESIAPGTGTESLRSAMSERWMIKQTGGLETDGMKTFRIYSSVGFGRHTCVVTHDGSSVIQVRHDYQD